MKYSQPCATGIGLKVWVNIQHSVSVAMPKKHQRWSDAHGRKASKGESIESHLVPMTAAQSSMHVPAHPQSTNFTQFYNSLHRCTNKEAQESIRDGVMLTALRLAKGNPSSLIFCQRLLHNI